MTSTGKSPRSSKPSIKYNGHSVNGACFALADFSDGKNCAPSSSDSCRVNGPKSEPSSSEILSTTDLISVAGHIWQSANHHLVFLQPRTKARHVISEFPEINVSRYFRVEGDARLSAFDHASTGAKENLEFLRVSEKISSFVPQSWSFVRNLLRDSSHCSSYIPDECLASVGISNDLRDIYTWISRPSDMGPKQQVTSVVVENKNIRESVISNDRESTSFGCVDSPVNNLINGNLSSDLQRAEENGDVLSTPSSRLCKDDSHVLEECQLKHEDVDVFLRKRLEDEFVETGKSVVEVLSQTRSESKYGLAKQEHAIAGALAGLSVSLCLHPVDTVKTVIQTSRADIRSINYIGRSIISERGVTGLYRGIASNIASSAPISALYTFTYESVKGVMLPLLPVDYQSLAHCTAGGCASVATSFIFTPSEHIKQQMQVGSRYQNCWKAILGIIKMGGLSSLYAGWGAVLFRNVPHSIIKFYTYESLKKLMSSSQESNAHPNTSQTLVCGGLAGSTAALFTTPFDVVKTRLQTQIPGSTLRYDGVLNTLSHIRKNEGLKGLYRGLIPRLFMYVSQGAIFFASYESFKRLFSLEVPHLHSQTTEFGHKMEEKAP